MGPATAARLVEEFGMDIPRVLDSADALKLLVKVRVGPPGCHPLIGWHSLETSRQLQGVGMEVGANAWYQKQR